MATAPARILLLLPVVLMLGLACERARGASAGQTQEQLRALQDRIERVSREVGRDAVERDRLAHNLRDAEVAVAATRADLEGVRAQESAHSARRAALAAERETVNATLARERAGLASQLRVAYLIGRHEPLQLMLNQRDPAAAARLYTWYGYFGRARAAQIASIAQQVERINALDAELARLRAEKSTAAPDPFTLTVLAETARAARLNQQLALAPEKRIPELQYLTLADWLEATRDADLDSDAGVRKALSRLRRLAKSRLYPAWQQAFRAYLDKHDNQLPADLAQLKPYFETPVDDAVLTRYQLLVTGSANTLNPGDYIMTEKAAVDQVRTGDLALGVDLAVVHVDTALVERAPAVAA